ncbi:MAG: hypothetical protein IPL35_00015 [Sphingobacteriales bacterium]|nr:hypothetical protein [Sphingobacteriales bacterium]
MTHPITPNCPPTLCMWKAGYSYIYDQNGNKTDLLPLLRNKVLAVRTKPITVRGCATKSDATSHLYGINLDLGAGFSWVYDVTDYAPVFCNKVRLSSGNAQELLDLKFYLSKARRRVRAAYQKSVEWQFSVFRYIK